MKTILAATDFTSASSGALNYAASLAEATSSKLLIMHATQIPVVHDTFFDAASSMVEIEKADRQKMEKVHRNLQAKFPDLRIQDQVKIGFAGEMIRELSNKGKVSLVVMGITHMDKLSEVMFGSTATAVASGLNCPVLIVPEKSRYRDWKKIAFAFDQKNIPATQGIKVLKDLRAHFDAEIHYVNVLDPNFTEKDESSLKPVFKALNDKSKNVHFLNSVPGQTVEVLQDWVKRNRASALVMIARRHNLLWRMFNEPRTKKMAFLTSVPLLILSEK